MIYCVNDRSIHPHPRTERCRHVLGGVRNSVTEPVRWERSTFSCTMFILSKLSALRLSHFHNRSAVEKALPYLYLLIAQSLVGLCAPSAPELTHLPPLPCPRPPPHPRKPGPLKPQPLCTSDSVYSGLTTIFAGETPPIPQNPVQSSSRLNLTALPVCF